MKKHSEGEELDLSQFVSADEVSKIENAKLELTEATGLKDYFEFFEEQMPYWKIKLGLYLLDS
jgi:ATP-dependent DNA helicase RecQ